jgi:FKBP12-rapamycin complex-associated protein
VLLLGRLSAINPAYIFPSLRSYLVDVVKEIEASEDIHKKESSAKLFGKVIRSLSKLVKPYTDTLVKQLLGVIRQEQSSRLSAYGLAALGDLAEVAGDTMLQYMDELMPLVIENFQEQSSSTKRYVALKTLDSLVENTGYVIEPFLKYPRLLDTILNKIKREDQATTRSQLIRLLGTMGALDPYKYKQLQLEQLEDSEEAANSSTVKTTPSSNGNGKENGASQPPVQIQQGPELNASGDASDSDLMRGVSLASEDYYPSIALTILLQFLRKPYGALATVCLLLLLFHA